MKLDKKQTDLVLVHLFMAALALIVTLIPGAAFAQEKQGRGRRVAPQRQAGTQVEPNADQVQEKLNLIETREGNANFSNPLLDTRTVRFDVSENATRFVFDETPVHPDGSPAYGNEFVTEGYIYPFGTLNGANGVNADGSPEFPDRVMGRWTCRGWHVGDGAKTVTGPWVITHQLYDLGPKPGQATLSTDGVELADVGVQVKRALIGGTGPYAEATGEATQAMIGFNQLNGVNLRVEIRVVIRKGNLRE